MSSQVEDFSSLARTLCSNPHRTVLLKNAFQYQHELSKMGLGSPKSTNIDMTLFSLGGMRARAEDLQPLNDPFLTDNIFKTPKKRRRGLLSWSALPLTETHRRKSGEKSHHPYEGVSHLWDFSRHIRARNRRRSILGTKHSLSSIRRRRPRPAACGEHTRSISDPTPAINSVAPRAAAAAAASRPSDCAESERSPSYRQRAKSHRNTSGGLTECRSSESLHAFGRASGVYRRLRDAACRQVHAFPRLNENASSSTIFTDHLLAVPFPSPPPAAHCAESAGSSASTLRGVPGYPSAAAVYPSISSADTYPRLRSSTPYISVSALRLISNNNNSTVDSLHSYASSIREPAPALRKPEKALRAQRCISMPHVPSGADNVKDIGTMDVRIATASVRDIPRCLVAAVPYEIASPYTKFSAVKNSLEIRQPALCSRGCQSQSQSQCQSLSPSQTSTSSSDDSGWLLPVAVGILRRMALCGGKRSGGPA